MKSKIEEFKDGDKLRITRVDKLGKASTGSLKDNYLDDNEVSKIKSYDVDMKDGVATESKEVLAFNGVVAPIQNSSKDIVKNSDGTYKIANKITSIEYTIVDNTTGHIYLKQSKKVGLDRMISNRVRNSLFEFRHILQVPTEIAGKNISVRISAKDSYENTILGTQENINLAVTHSK
ncbi:hypothetical protein [Streptococcus anginosus]|uniref:hypothetical protein n=1 Tax=Streptococcus anginosus TaxID=1328 RepID=UPI00321C37E4